MKLKTTPLEGLFVIEPEPVADERGAFARTFCESTFASWQLASRYVQASVSFNPRRGTLRGMHFQARPNGETKLIRCTRGVVYDVALDLREGSPTRGRWHAVELSAANRLSLYVPEMFAHGFLTLSDDAELYYQMSAPYVTEAARGVRFDDPAFGIAWPFEPSVVSARDRQHPDFAA